MYTLQEVATAICEASGRSDREAVRARLRNFTGRAFIEPDLSDGVRRLDRLSAAVAAVLNQAAENGLTGDDLRHLESVLRQGRNVVDVLIGTFEINLAATLERIAAGEDWIVEVTRRRIETGETVLIATLAQRHADGEVTRWRLPGESEWEITSRQAIEITPLLRGVCAHLDAIPAWKA